MFKVTPKGSDSRSNAPFAAVWLQIAVAVLAVAGIAYQSAAQLFGLPGRLTLFAYGVTAFWTLLSAGLIGSTVLWASRIQHRRGIHRFPAAVTACYSTSPGSPPTSPGSPQLKPAAVFDLNQSGLGMLTREGLMVGQRLRVLLELGTNRITTDAVVASSIRRPDRFRVGVQFDELDRSAEDLICRWCFSRPFGPAHAIGETQPERPGADELRRSA
jgi:hypothetical protein